MHTDPSQRRRARRARPQPTVSDLERGRTPAAEAPAGPGAPAPAAPTLGPAAPARVGGSSHQILGVRPGATALQVVKAYQRALRTTSDDAKRRELAAAFRRLGARPIRTRCPQKHDLVLYAIDGDTHGAFCSHCHNPQAGHDGMYRYVGWAECSATDAFPEPPMDPDDLPYGVDPVGQRRVRVSYRTPAGPRELQWVMSDRVPLRLAPGDFFSVLFAHDDVAWWLLNHSTAVTMPLDPLLEQRPQLQAVAEQRAARERAEGIRGR